MEEGKGQGGLATSHQYGNALLGVCYQEEEEMQRYREEKLTFVQGNSVLNSNNDEHLS